VSKNVIAKNICNLSRIPINMKDNPVYNTCLELLNNPNIGYKDSSIYSFKFNPTTLGDIFGVSKLNSYGYTAVFLPWIHKKPQEKINDQAFINFNRENKFNKIKGLMSSISSVGYFPEKFPDRKKGIRGYWLEYKGKIKTYIISGNHRAAVLSALNIEIPFMYEDGNLLKHRETLGVGIDVMNYPSIFSDKSVDNWPAVKSGCINRKTALSIISKYFEE
jgi:hypothetical protein